MNFGGMNFPDFSPEQAGSPTDRGAPSISGQPAAPSIRDRQAYTALGFVEWYMDHPGYLPGYIAERLYEVGRKIQQMRLPSVADPDGHLGATEQL